MSCVTTVILNLTKAAKDHKNEHILYEVGNDEIIVTCIPDIIDRIEWFCNGLHISASYAKVLIERGLRK